MDRHPREAGQHPCGVHRHSTPFRMHADQRILAGRRRMHPVQTARHPQPGLVEVRHGRRGQRGPDTIGEPTAAHRIGCASRPGRHCARRHRRGEQFRQSVRGALPRQELPRIQVHADRRRVRPVLGGCPHPGRRRSTGELPAVATAFHQPMLGHPHPDRWDVEHLPTHHARHTRAGRQAGPAATTSDRLMPLDLVRRLNLAQRAALMTSLATRLPAAAAPQRARCRPDKQRIRRRRPRRVRRILIQPPPQLRVLRPAVRPPRPATASPSQPAPHRRAADRQAHPPNEPKINQLRNLLTSYASGTFSL